MKAIDCLSDFERKRWLSTFDVSRQTNNKQEEQEDSRCTLMSRSLSCWSWWEDDEAEGVFVILSFCCHLLSEDLNYGLPTVISLLRHLYSCCQSCCCWILCLLSFRASLSFSRLWFLMLSSTQFNTHTETLLSFHTFIHSLFLPDKLFSFCLSMSFIVEHVVGEALCLSIQVHSWNTTTKEKADFILSFESIQCHSCLPVFFEVFFEKDLKFYTKFRTLFFTLFWRKKSSHLSVCMLVYWRGSN